MRFIWILLGYNNQGLCPRNVPLVSPVLLATEDEEKNAAAHKHGQLNDAKNLHDEHGYTQQAKPLNVLLVDVPAGKNKCEAKQARLNQSTAIYLRIVDVGEKIIDQLGTIYIYIYDSVY